MSAVWILLGIAVGIAALMVGTSRLRRYQDVDLGSVSHQWIAEQRLGPGHDSHR